MRTFFLSLRGDDKKIEVWKCGNNSLWCLNPSKALGTSKLEVLFEFADQALGHSCRVTLPQTVLLADAVVGCLLSPAGWTLPRRPWVTPQAVWLALASPKAFPEEPCLASHAAHGGTGKRGLDAHCQQQCWVFGTGPLSQTQQALRLPLPMALHCSRVSKEHVQGRRGSSQAEPTQDPTQS